MEGLDPKRQESLLLATSQLVGLLAAAVQDLDGDGSHLNVGANVAKASTQYNYLMHDEVQQMVAEYDQCQDKSCKAEVRERYAELDEKRNRELPEVCQNDMQACLALYDQLTADDPKIRELAEQLRLKGSPGAAMVGYNVVQSNEQAQGEILQNVVVERDGEAAGFWAALAQTMVGVVGGKVTSQKTSSSAGRSQSEDGSAAASEKGGTLKVTAEGNIGGETFKDVNQTARPAALADSDQPTLIAGRIAEKSAAKPDKNFPNGNMADAHAEIGVIQQAYNSGKTVGAEMSMSVAGKDVCGYCKGDIAAAAEKAGLKSLTVSAVDDLTGTPKTYHWEPGMKSIREIR